MLWLLLLLSCFSRVRLCATPQTAAHQAPPSLRILQARTLVWIAISFSSAWKWKVKVKSLSRVRLLVTPWTAAHQAPPSMEFSRHEYWSGLPLPSPQNYGENSKKISGCQESGMRERWISRAQRSFFLSVKLFCVILNGDTFCCTVIKTQEWFLPGHSVTKTPRSQCRGPQFNRWSGN